MNKWIQLYYYDSQVDLFSLIFLEDIEDISKLTDL